MRHRRWFLRAMALGAPWLLFASRADAESEIQDYWSGTELYLDGASINVGGNVYNATALNITKSGSTYDTVVSARALGLDLDLDVHLHGTALSGNRISFTFAETFWMDLGSVRVVSADGTLVALVTPRYGDRPLETCGATCQYSVDLIDAPGGVINLHGQQKNFWGGWDDFNPSFTDFHFHAIGGVPQPQLASATLGVPADRICSSSGSRRYAGHATLAGPAPLQGTWVDVITSDHVHFPNQRTIAFMGSTDAAFTFQVPAGYIGNVTVMVASAGAKVMTPLSVTYCLPNLDEQYLADPGFESAFPCQSCRGNVHVTDTGMAVIQYNGSTLVNGPSGQVSLDKIAGTTVDSPFVNAFGEVVAHTKDGSAIHVKDIFKSPKIKTFKAFQPNGIDELGEMLGVCTDVMTSCSETNGAVYQFDGGKGTIDSVASTIAGLTVGTMTTDQGIRAYRRELDGKTTTLDSLLDETRALAVNDAGYTVGWSVAEDKLRHAVMYEPGKTSPLTLSTPAGYGSYAVGITDEGLIVGNLEKGSAKTPVLWSMTDPGKMQLLSKNIGTPGVTVTEILEVTRFGKIVARAKYNGVSTVLVLGGK